jgi:hypothetical protein
VVAFAVLIAIQARQLMVAPPMHRIWTVVDGDNTELHLVANGIAYYSAEEEAGAVPISSGKALLTRTLPGSKTTAARPASTPPFKVDGKP